MNKQKVGLVVFWLAVIWAFAWGIIGSIYQNRFFMKIMEYAEFSQSIWRLEGPLANIWGLGVPLSFIIAAVGVLIYAGAPKATAWKLGLGVPLAFIITVSIAASGHYPWLFSLMGTLILVNFFWILWNWAKERPTLSGNAATGADLKLAGYVFLLMGMWFTCGVVGWFMSKALSSQPYPVSPISLMIYFALGLLFICLGQWKTVQNKR